ncbi:MAG: hypothetical protein IKL55_03700 [Clostridia bacterium]|nr:hypothetical protein [Clostridia bacterium]
MKKSILFLQIILFLLICIVALNKSAETYKFNKKVDDIYNYNDNKIIKENEFYEISIDKEYENQGFNNPYIPDNFAYVEGEWNTGFVIEDLNGNQYVWVPCSNKENNLTEKLGRKDFSEEPFISKDECINENCEDFILSSLENGGFYISRYELGKENNTIVSKPDVKLLKNTTKKEAEKLISEMYSDLNCELINGYAYDTTLSWLKNTNEIKINKIEDKENLKTGRAKYNNIYDFCDNILEMSSEYYYGTVIIRGFLFADNENNFNSELVENLEYNINSFDRMSIREEDNYYTPEHIMGFRTVLYK